MRFVLKGALLFLCLCFFENGILSNPPPGGRRGGKGRGPPVNCDDPEDVARRREEEQCMRDKMREQYPEKEAAMDECNESGKLLVDLKCEGNMEEKRKIYRCLRDKREEEGEGPPSDEERQMMRQIFDECKKERSSSE